MDVKKLSKRFQKTFIRLLREHWEFQGIPFRGKAVIYEDIEQWRNLFWSIQMPWVVFAKAPSAGAKQTLKYLSRYTHSVAISEHRILELTSDKVCFQYKDYADEDDSGLPKKKVRALDYLVFIKMFVKHILPSGFQKIRYFGLWASTNRKTKLAKCQLLLGLIPLLLTMQTIKALVKLKFGIDPALCSYCGSSDILTSVIYPPAKPSRYQLMDRLAKIRPPPSAPTSQQAGCKQQRA